MNNSCVLMYEYNYCLLLLHCNNSDWCLPVCLSQLGNIFCTQDLSGHDFVFLVGIVRLMSYRYVSCLFVTIGKHFLYTGSKRTWLRIPRGHCPPFVLLVRVVFVCHNWETLSVHRI